MPDVVDPTPPTPAPEAKRPKASTTAGKDVRRARANKNRTSALPDRSKEAQLEAEALTQLGRRESLSLLPWQQTVVNLQRQGWSISRILRASKISKKGRPCNSKAHVVGSLGTIPADPIFYRLRREQPEWVEAGDKAFREYADSRMPEIMTTAAHYRQINRRDDKRMPDLLAAHYEVEDTHRLIRSVLPDRYGVLATGDREVIVFEPYGGWVPTKRLQGAPGQGPEAEAARERWKRIREQGEDAPGAPGDAPGR